MSYFLCPNETIESIDLPSHIGEEKTYKFPNRPVNLDLCFTFHKSSYLKGFPSISFKGDRQFVEWIFDDEEKRDEVYKNLKDQVWSITA